MKTDKIILMAILMAIFLFCATFAVQALHAQTLPDATTVTLSGSAATTESIVKAIEPGWNWTLINSTIIGIVLISRTILKYFMPANPTPGSLAAKVSGVLSHTGGVITVLLLGLCLSLPLGLTGCSTAQIATFKADANRAAEDVLTAAPKVLAYTATTAQDIGILTLDLTKGAAAVVTLTTTSTSTPAAPSHP